jgi:hypothetical protein
LLSIDIVYKSLFRFFIGNSLAFSSQNSKEITMKKTILSGLLLILSLCACSPSEKEIQLTATQVAKEIFGTQTALAPTATFTSTPTPTNTPLPTSTPTDTPEPTNTPPPPTPTLDADGVEKMILCYKAAVTIWADWDTYYHVKGKRWSYSEALFNDLTAFRNERRNRVSAIITKTGFGNGSLNVDGMILNDSVCAGEKSAILSVNFAIESLNPWGVGGSSRLTAYFGQAESAAKKLREALENTYGVDSAELDAIADPIWQHVHNRYGVELP